jgi:hypothetical protein
MMHPGSSNVSPCDTSQYWGLEKEGNGLVKSLTFHPPILTEVRKKGNAI